MNLPDSIKTVPAKMDMWQILDSTKLQAYAACPRQYFFEYVLGWRVDTASNHLVFGQAWHAALEHLFQNGLNPKEILKAFDLFMAVYRKSWPESTDAWFGGKTPEAAIYALAEYCHEYASDFYKYEVAATEVFDYLPLSAQDSMVVKLDAVLRSQDTNRMFIMEHKTGSSAGQWWARQWHLSLQVGAYIAACNFYYGQKDTACIVDGTFFLKTKRNFQRELVSRSEDSINVWLQTVLSLIRRIEQDFVVLAEEDDPSFVAQKSFPQNPVSCEKYGGCQFYDLCLGVTNPLRLLQSSAQPPIGFKIEWWNPLESKQPLA